ncbi:MAG: secretory protein, partial [Pedobacter sp.]
MFKKIHSIVLLLIMAQLSFAQRNQGYKLTILDPDNKVDDRQKTEITQAFNLVYPEFARADGYRTKRDVTLEFADGLSESMTAQAGKIVVNKSWFLNNSSKFERELRVKFAKNWVSSDTIKKKGYQLVFISKDPNLDQKVKQNLIDTYFKVYPKLVKTYNKNSTKEVLFVVDTAYKAVAEASGGRILFSAGYMKAHPTDIDVVTHETMHIVQGYGYSA